MTQTASGVLKGSQVRLAGRQRIGDSAPQAAEARIVEQAPGRAVIEVLCPCGNTIHLECTCGPEPAPAGEQPPGAA